MIMNSSQLNDDEEDIFERFNKVKVREQLWTGLPGSDLWWEVPSQG